MNAPVAPVDILVLRLKAKKSGNGWIAQCPAHDDQKPSLSINEGANGVALVRCHAGCTLDAVLSAVGLTKRDLFPDALRLRTKKRAKGFRTLDAAVAFIERKLSMKAKRRDTYRKQNGKEHFVIVRFENGKGEKDFRPFHQKSTGWQIKDPNGKLSLFNLPEVLKHKNEPLVIVEGEKCVSKWSTLDILATTSAHGAQAPEKTDWSPLAGRSDLFIQPDNDASGYGYAEKVNAILSELSPPASARFLVLPDLPPSGDNVDWLERRDAQDPDDIKAELRDLMSKAPSTLFRNELVDFGSLLDSICAFVRRFIVFQMPEQAWAIALWVAHCWVIEAFDFTPYLHVNSPEKQCAKTRLLDCLALLVVRAWRAILPSEPVLFRTIESEWPTLLLDEADGIFTNKGNDERREALRSLLNAGFERGAKVPRCVGQGTNQEVRNFAVFCAKAIAGIGKLPDTVRDRSVPIQLVRRSRDEKVERFRKREAEKEASAIRAELEAWAKQPDIIEKLRDARPSLPDALSDRQQDIVEPLLAIADMAGGDWPERARAALVALCSQSDDDESLGVKLLLAIRDVFNDEQCDKIATQDLLKTLVDQETDAPWASWWEGDLRSGNTRGPAQRLARLLKPYKIVARVIRMTDDSTPRGYRRDDFSEAWKRYLPSNAQNNATTQHSNQLSL